MLGNSDSDRLRQIVQRHVEACGSGHTAKAEEPKPKSRGNRSAQIRELLSQGLAPGDIARIVGCSRNAVCVARWKHEKRKQRRLVLRPDQHASGAPEPIVVGPRDKLLEALTIHLPSGYEDDPRSLAERHAPFRQSPPTHSGPGCAAAMCAYGVSGFPSTGRAYRR